MTAPIVTKEEMLSTRVARYKELKAFPHAFLDTMIPEFERDIMSVIGDSVMEDSDMAPPIANEHCFSIGLIRLEPGQGAGLHAHSTEEVFIPLNGKFTLIWGDKGDKEVTLEKWDTCSVPIGVMRGFRNDDDHTVVAMAIVGGHDGGRVDWHDDLIARAKEFGGQLNEDGYIESN
jgi:quercetin dioxygenase-like cupin family protein